MATRSVRWIALGALACCVAWLVLRPDVELWPPRGPKGVNRPGLIYWQGSPDAERVALTFDDGPRDPFTGEILDILKAHDVKATFFVIGRNVEQYPELARRIAREGHAIGNHSASHAKAAFFFERGARREIVRAEEAIEQATGTRPALYRPPRGRWSERSLRLTRDMGLVTIRWSVCPRDWEQPSPREIVERTLAKVGNGSIILLHDGYPPTKPAERRNTVLALPALIAELRARGYQLVTVPELLGLQPARERAPSSG